ncbi:MAG: hypothetical protein ABIH23_18250 [bacterium]
MTHEDIEAFDKLFVVSLLVAIVGMWGMILTNVYCFIPLAAIGLCGSLFFGMAFVMFHVLPKAD